MVIGRVKVRVCLIKKFWGPENYTGNTVERRLRDRLLGNANELGRGEEPKEKSKVAK